MFKAVRSQIDFPAAEREVLAFWEKEGVYARSLEQRRGGKPFVFFEGPPTANGLPHPGHCLTRAMKDVFPRYKTMTGHYCLRKGGWDTHGLPVEVEVCKALGIHTKEEIEAYGVEAFNRKCLESVFRYTKEWEELTRRLGFWVNLDEAYVTYHQSYVESVWWSLKQLFDAGLLYQGHKIVWWWAQGGTALSAGEVGQGYREVDDPSVVVRFPLVPDERLAAFMGSLGVPPVRKDEKPDRAGVVETPVTGDLTRRRRILPHWEAGGSTYVLTFRLQEGTLTEDERSLVLEACRHWDSTRFELHAAVVMPDHVHLLCTPMARPSGQWWSVADLMHSIKGYTAKEINARRGSAGAVWQREYFDRIIRSASDFQEKWEYVVSNPRRRGLPEDYAWVWVEGAEDSHRRDADAPRSGESHGRDGGAPRSEDSHRRDADAPRSGESHGRDGGAPRSGDSHRRDADAPRSGELQWGDGGAPRSGDSHRRDADAPRSGELDRPEAAGSVVEGRADDGSEPRISLLVWTTTPWTLPSNMFAAVHRDFDYAVVVDEETGERLILAAALVESIAKKVKKTSWKVVSTCKGRDLVGLRYLPPYEDYHRRAAADFVGGGDATPLGEYRAALVDGGQAPVAWRVVAADFVTLDAGTGLVHEAPAFGEVDFDLYRQERSRFENPESIPLLCAVGPEGVFTDDVAAYAGRWVKACDKDICRELRDRGLLLHQEQYRHDYPFCWRAEEDPLIQYPRRSWFIRTTRFKEAMLENNASIRWLPEHIKTGRFGKFLESNVDWSLSRERYWGTPLPIWVCDNDACGYREAVDSYDGLTSKPGAAGMEVWGDAKRKSPELSDHLKVHKPYIDAVTYGCSKCGTGTMRRVPEVIDCWYDSGAMPFAQWGWPHRNQEMFESQFPADFISEALDQTRGWFYSLVAISTMLFGKEGVARSETRGLSSMAAPYPLPFRNCIVLGLLMGEDGLKMSKSKKNYKDPTYIFEREGADAMRWLFLSGQAPWTSIRFQESAIAEGQREFLIRLYNCYSFFVIYANIDKWTPEQREGEAARSELDRWIVSGLDACCLRVYDCMETYDNFGAARALVEFVDGLSNWYVRRNRDRFWRAGMDADKRAAYTTLYDCLVTLCKLIAPFTPFLAESMYQNLVRTQDVEAAVSVHLCDYPVVAENRGAVADRIDETLNEQIAMVRQLVSCGRAARSAAKLRVRQPLAGIELYHCQAEVIRRYEQIVRQELNVKRIDYVSGADIDRYVHYEIKPDFKKIGPKHGPLAPKIKAALAGHSDVDGLVKQLERDQACVLDVDGRSVELTSDELIVELHAREGWSAERIPGRGILALDTQLTPALRDEGSARDLVNQVQQVRKSLDLRYEQRIDLGIAGDEDIERVVNVFGDTIKGETLAQQVSARPIANIEPVRSQVDGHDVAIYVHPL